MKTAETDATGKAVSRPATGRYWEPLNQAHAEIRAVFLGAVSDADLRAIVRALVKKSKRGDTVPTPEVVDRLVSKSQTAVQVIVEAVPRWNPFTDPEKVVTAIEDAADRERAEREKPNIPKRGSKLRHEFLTIFGRCMVESHPGRYHARGYRKENAP